MTFDSLNLAEPLLKAVREEGYTTPTPIQAQAIPHILNGADLLGCAQTGTGKTAAFAIPMLQRLAATPWPGKKRQTRALILTPTRELAVQISESFTNYGRYTGLTNTTIFGGVGQNPQVLALQRGIDIVIATPGRLLDLIKQGHVSFKHLEVFVLDEADRMLDMGFIHDVRRIITFIPPKRQTLFFSATMPPEIAKLADAILTKPEKVAVTPVSSTVEIIQQSLYYVDKSNKNKLLVKLLDNPAMKTALVFSRTKHGADKIVKVLLNHDIEAEAIHGNKGQNVRQRALANFKAQTTRVLVATDIAARGIDVDSLEWVINYDIPNVAETYVHRIGRTGRAGASGSAISFCDAEERSLIRDIEKLIGKKIPVVDDHEFKLTVHEPVSASAKSPARSMHQQRPKNPVAKKKWASKWSGPKRGGER